MKNFSNYLLLTTFVISAQLLAQSKNNVEFNYDKSGKLIERKTRAIQLNNFSRNSIQDSTSHVPQFNISPIPTNDVINITRDKSSKKNIFKIELYSLTGQLVQSKFCDNASITAFDVNSIKTGLYLLVIFSSQNEREIHKVIIND